jgi:hypothetical protein
MTRAARKHWKIKIHRDFEPSYITNGYTCNADLRRLRTLPGLWRHLAQRTATLTTPTPTQTCPNATADAIGGFFFLVLFLILFSVLFPPIKRGLLFFFLFFLLFFLIFSGGTCSAAEHETRRPWPKGQRNALSAAARQGNEIITATTLTRFLTCKVVVF